MENHDAPARPIPIAIDQEGQIVSSESEGLTKLEYISMHLMAGMLAEGKTPNECMAEESVCHAACLLEALESHNE